MKRCKKASVNVIEGDEEEEISIVKVQAVKDKSYVHQDVRQSGTCQISN